MDLELTWRTGPDAGGRTPLLPGSHIVGTIGIRCDDRRLRAHHARIDVVDNGGGPNAVITRLTGRDPVTVAGQAIDGPHPIPIGALVRIGASSFVIGPAAPPLDTASTERLVQVVRSPRSIDPDVVALFDQADVPQLSPTAPAPPPAPAMPERERPGGLVPTLVGLGGSALLAIVTGRASFVAFGALGGVVALSSWVTQRIAFARRYRRAVAARDDTIARQTIEHETTIRRRHAALVAAAPGLATALAAATPPHTDLWVRRRAHCDAFVAAWGIDATGLLPVAGDLGPGRRIAITGPLAEDVARSALVQLVTACGPADLRIVIATSAPARWESLAAVPHISFTHDGADLCHGGAAHVIVVVDGAAGLVDRSSALRRAIDAMVDSAVLVVERSDTVPHLCDAVLATRADGSGEWTTAPGRLDRSTDLLVVGIGTSRAALVGHSLHHLVDPEDTVGPTLSIAPVVDLEGLLDGRTSLAIAQRWTSTVDPPLRIVVGLTSNGPLEIDLERDGPHALVAGTTGSGKSEFLRSLVVGLAEACSPLHASFVLIDFKGGAAFDELDRLPHVAGVITDLDDDLADRVLRSLHAELRRREDAFRTAGAHDLAAYRTSARAPIPRLIVVIDEFAALVVERPSFLHALVGIAQRGRSLGVHLVLATQRPAGVVSDDIRANTAMRIALRLNDSTDALDIVGDAAPTSFPRATPGRAMVRLGGEPAVVAQTARCTDARRTVDRLVDAAILAGVTTPPRPWVDPLPLDLDPALATSLDVEAVGVLDDPDHQRWLPLVATREVGALLVVGGRGSGVTSTLLSIVHSRLRRSPAAECYVFDAAGDEAWTALDGRRRAVVVTPHDDRWPMVLHRLTTLRPPAGDVTVVVDGIDSLRRMLDVPAHDHRAAHRHETRIDQLLAALLGAHDAGARVLVGAATAAEIPPTILARAAHRWVLHLDDRQQAHTLGLPTSMIPPAAPGRVRVDHLLGQVIRPVSEHDEPAAAIERRPPTWWIGPLPVAIDPQELEVGHRDQAVTAAVIGLDPTNGLPVVLHIDDGEHLMLLGPRRSGRTTALATLSSAIVAAGGSAPRLVDDADRVDDLDGELARYCELGDTTVIAAARPDVLAGRYGHWTTAIRRGRLGLVLVGPTGDADADLLGATVPRRYPVTPRPGAGWLIDGTTVTPVLLAAGTPHATTTRDLSGVGRQ